MEHEPGYLTSDQPALQNTSTVQKSQGGKGAHRYCVGFHPLGLALIALHAFPIIVSLAASEDELRGRASA